MLRHRSLRLVVRFGQASQLRQQPAIKEKRGVSILGPWCKLAFKDFPFFFRGIHGRVIVIGGWWIHHEPSPVSDENQDQSDQLKRCPKVHEKPGEKIAESNLAQDVGEDPVRAFVSHRIQKDAEQNQCDRSNQSMKCAGDGSVSLRFSSGIGERHRRTDHEHKRRLNQIPKRHFESVE